MRRPGQLLLLAFILGLTAFSVAVVWPDDPDRYLPDFIPWPSGTGLKIGGLDREAMRLGLDLKGGTYVLLEGDTSNVQDVDDAMEGVKQVIENRINRYGVAETEIQREGRNRLAVQLPGISPEEARELIGRTAQLAFREPRRDDAGNIICRDEDGSEVPVPPGSVTYIDELKAATCLPAGTVAEWLSATCQGDTCGDLQGKTLTGNTFAPTPEWKAPLRGLW